MGDPKDAKDKKERAKQLHDAAEEAKKLAQRLGTFLDDPVGQATAHEVWHGPFAQASTATLKQRRDSLSRMADDLRADARRWQTEADRLNAEAK